MKYREFINSKLQLDKDSGFIPKFLPDYLIDFQVYLTEWAIKKGRGAIFADCGFGKTIMELVWAENVLRETGKPVLILTPLAVSQQTLRESEKFGIECTVSKDGKHRGGIVVTNYERLHYFNRHDFIGVVGDESSRIKHANSKTRKVLTEFMREIPYRLLGTATAAPNDYFELGTSSEALGYLGYQDMITRFFKEEQKKDILGWGRKTYRFRGHAEHPFWRWVCSWARSCRKPSDLGFDDGKFILPQLLEREHYITTEAIREGFLFTIPAKDLREQREERRITLKERCEKVADMVTKHDGATISWCHLNPEGDLLEKIIPDSVQVKGSQSDDEKEEKLLAFQRGEIKRLVIKPRIGAWGMNWQHCHYITTFPSHSWEQYYQLVRRCWRFGQEKPVVVDIITTEGEAGIMKNLQRKAEQCDRMFDALVKNMGDELRIARSTDHKTKEKIPQWLA